MICDFQGGDGWGRERVTTDEEVTTYEYLYNIVVISVQRHQSKVLLPSTVIKPLLSFQFPVVFVALVV